MNNIKDFLNFKIDESLLTQSENSFEIELNNKFFDIYWNGKVYVDSKGEFKIGPRNKTISDLSSLGIEPDHEYEIDNSSISLLLKYSWDILTRKFGITDIDFIPNSAAIRFDVIKIDREGNEESFEFEFEIEEFGDFSTDLGLPLSDISVELSAKKDFKSLETPNSWKWEFFIGNKS